MQSGFHPFPPFRGRLPGIQSHGRCEITASTRHFQRSGLQRNSFRLLCPLLTSALRSGPCDDLSPVAGTQRRSPEVRSTAFTARPPDLPPRSLMTVDFAIICSLVRPGRPRYPVLVHRAAALLHASFRPHLAVTPLRFANPSPPSGWIEDFHLQAVDHTRHTKRDPGLSVPGAKKGTWIGGFSDSVPCDRSAPPVELVVQARLDHIKALGDISLYRKNKTGRNVVGQANKWVEFAPLVPKSR